MTARKLFTVSSLSKFVQKEVWHEDFHLKRVLEGDPEEQIISGEVLGPLQQYGREGRALILRGHGLYYSRFRAGDQVDIGFVDPSTKKFKSVSGTSIHSIRFPEPGVLEVLVPGDNMSAQTADLFLLPKTHSGIKRLLLQKLRDLEILGVQAEHHPVNSIAVRRNYAHMSEHLNSTQKDALKFLIDNDFKGLIQGPPGTGKTHLLAALINLATSSGIRVGLAALTHAAVDNALARLLRSGLPLRDVVRVASKKQAIKKEPYGNIDISGSWAGSFSNVEHDYLLYAATMHSWCMSSSPPDIDLLIIDEASQVPLYFHPFLDKLCSRVIMFGDHKQLPPVIQISNHDLPSEDIFSYEIEQAGGPMLVTQYRMNQWIQEWSAKRFYQGQLKPHESVRERDVLSGIQNLGSVIGANAINLVSHSGNSTHYANPIEAKRVAEIVWALRSEGKLPLKEIGVVAPHRAHAGAICAELQQKMGVNDAQEILVDTVERFQGQEREAMIFSLGVDRDESKRGARPFLGDGRRLNVAVTRAKSRFYCLAPEKLVDRTLSAPGDSDLKSMLSWCGAKIGPHVQSINAGGYVTKDFASGHREFEHRAIAEKILRRRLYIGEHVHHINGVEDDNRPENLCVLDEIDHAKFHDWYEAIKNKRGQIPSIEEQLQKLKELNGVLLNDTESNF